MLPPRVAKPPQKIIKKRPKYRARKVNSEDGTENRKLNETPEFLNQGDIREHEIFANRTAMSDKQLEKDDFIFLSQKEKRSKILNRKTRKM